MAACNDALVRLGLGELPAKWVDSVFESNFVGTKGAPAAFHAQQPAAQPSLRAPTRL